MLVEFVSSLLVPKHSLVEREQSEQLQFHRQYLPVRYFLERPMQIQGLGDTHPTNAKYAALPASTSELIVYLNHIPFDVVLWLFYGKHADFFDLWM